MNKLTVTAAPECTVPIHTSDNPNGGHTLLKPGESMEVFETTNMRRRIRSGDLIVQNGKTSARTLDTKLALDPKHADHPSNKAAKAAAEKTK